MTYEVAQQIDAGDRVIVGVNQFAIESEERYEPMRVNPAIEAEQIERLRALRADRDQAKVDAALADIRRAAEGTDNLLAPMRVALQARATVGEVSDALRAVWGQYRPIDTL